MGKVIYIEDKKAGIHRFYSELGERKPETQMEVSVSFVKDHFWIFTPAELKGRGIKKDEAYCGTGKRGSWKSYHVTKKALEKLKKEYPITMECFFD